MNMFLNNFADVREKQDRAILLHLVWLSFLYIGITFAVFKVRGKVPVEKDKLAIKDIGSLKVVLKSFRNLRGMLDGPIDLLFFSLVTSQRTSSTFVGFIKEYSFGLLRYLEMNLDCLLFFQLLQVKWLLKLFAILKGLFI